MNKNKQLFFAASIILMLASCAHTENISACVDPVETFGFWGGLWHGTIAVFSLIGEAFDDNIKVYAVNNNGGWYDFGFILGIGGLVSNVIKGIIVGLSK